MSRLLAFIRRSLRQENSLQQSENLQRYHDLQTELQQLRPRVEFLEHRLTNYYTDRWNVLYRAADYMVNAELEGDYAEFGVYKGTTFGFAASLFQVLFPKMRFLAFDSFEGLPELKGIDYRQDGFSSGFFKGQFAATEDEFRNNILNSLPQLAPERLIITKVWFDQTLTHETARNIQLNRLACIWIDCDLYESAVPVLKFITPYLSVGTVILFDEWRGFRNLPDYGEQRACREWLEANPGLTLNEAISYGFQGLVFTVASLPHAVE